MATGAHDADSMTRTRVRRALTIPLAAGALLGAGLGLHAAHAAASVPIAPRPVVMPMIRTPDHNLVPVPAAGEPEPGPLLYNGGQVEVTPKIYLVFWGWSNTTDPAATRMQSFVSAIGGTSWNGINTQYYDTVGAANVNITNPAQLLAGVWFDSTDPIHDNLSGQDIANEALRGVQHFGITDFQDANVVVAQPSNANDAGFNQGSYCAWHDWSTDGYTLPAGSPNFAFTSMPYMLNAGSNCGQDFVNAAPGGDLDGFTIVLGHEIAEAITDPGAGTSGDAGWIDLNGYETGDKCAWVSFGPGAATDITGNDGRSYPVQGLWDNSALDGAGYCTN